MEKERSIDYKTGLSNEEVAKRASEGKVNGISKPASKTYGQIIKDNVCTLFNLLNFLIFVALVLVQAWSNLVFMAIIVANALIGIYQEVKAKRLVDQLSILTKPTITVVRNGQTTVVDINDVVLDDVLVLESGNQVCNDATVIHGMIEANESLLTGESDPVNKKVDSELLSGSSVISGKCYAQVKNVGDNNYSTALVKEAQKVKEQNSELMDSMKKVTKVTTFMIIPLGIILFVEALWLRQDILFEAVVSSAAGLLGMLPKGLVLLTSVSLANGVARLAKKKVLVQDLYSLETLSHVDVLCLDKTGTITDGKMKVEETFMFEKNDQFDTLEIMGSYLRASDDNNATFQAMDEYFGENDLYDCSKKISFSSLRKWSAIEFKDIGTIVVGAAEKVISQTLPDEIKDKMLQGMRALAVGYTSESISDDQPLPELQPLMVIILSDTIRDHTKETLEYFHQEGVETKIISGDNVNTVMAIASKAGVLNYDRCIDMSTVDDKDLPKVVQEYTVFGRVTPNQKKLIVEALKADGHHVAMTGDGVNDLLALKDADCSIAIADGSDASKQISQVVLLNSDFTCLPDVLLEGRKVVNNVTRVAGVFFIKTIYSVLLSLFCVLTNTAFPFIPLQITLIDLLVEAMPSFMTIFESDIRKIKGSFLPKVFSKAIGNALAVVIIFIGIMLFGSNFGLNQLESVTLMYYVLITISMIAVIRSCYPFTKLRILICLMMVFGFILAILLFSNILHLANVSLSIVLSGLVLSAIGVLIERAIYRLIARYMKQHNL
ncbi:HAD-IC family P-type ATPase [uncultured Thomasclavelia sp.]|uniref:HAD-IC family P-type ATPase n=1 Tax=uncultured Thomasclavelia sp. TaxID=3025759 RepID=UPI0025CFE07F|nr:HAD-IC family P-type ATPase [uncultured Thomasclavelia sp.]